MTEKSALCGFTPQSDFESQYNRVLEAAGCRTQIELATVLEVRQSAISDAKRRQSVPSDWLITLCEKKRIAPDWIRSGLGEKIVQTANETGNMPPVEQNRTFDGHSVGSFASEQKILDHALDRLKDTDVALFSRTEFEGLVTEYGRLLQRMRNTVSHTDSMNRKIYELQDMMQQDLLTGIRNRRYLEDNLARIVSTLRRSSGELAVLMVDVDHFKRYNDLYGHCMGDASLKKVAAALEQALVRVDDFVARYGGEEFVVVLPNTGEDGSRLMAKRLHTSVLDSNIPYENGGAFACVTVSVGATAGKVTSDRCGNDFINLADKAMYQAKHDGRNKSVFLGFE